MILLKALPSPDAFRHFHPAAIIQPGLFGLAVLLVARDFVYFRYVSAVAVRYGAAELRSGLVVAEGYTVFDTL